jgi:hypothetical protein
LNSGIACRVSISDFRYAKGGKLQAFKKNCLAANAATSLHSRSTLAAQDDNLGCALNFALRNRPGVTSIM